VNGKILATGNAVVPVWLVSALSVFEEEWDGRRGKRGREGWQQVQ
jgi:hypothetical protein